MYLKDFFADLSGNCFNFSKKHNVFGLHPLAVSVIYILLTLYIASQLRKLVTAFTRSDSPARQLLLEFVATFELCAACFELIIGKYLGPKKYFTKIDTFYFLVVFKKDRISPSLASAMISRNKRQLAKGFYSRFVEESFCF